MSGKSRIAVLSAGVAVVAVLLAALGVTAARFGWVEPYVGFQIFGLGLVSGGILALVLGVAGLFRARRAGGMGAAVLGTAIGAGLLAVLVVLVAPHRGAPAIHDVTTDPEDPPQFHEIAKLPANEGRDLTYPHGGAGVPEKQRRAYPDLAPVRLALPADQAFNAAQNAVRELGWKVVWVNRSLGLIEATDTSPLFRFVDDVVIRVRGDADGSVIDVRSTSRVGVSDLGANARRIRQLVSLIRRLGNYTTR